MTLIDQGLEILEETQCWALLEQATLGRVGISVGALPAIFPVNYVASDGAVLFRTAPGTKLHAASRGAVVAFEVDHYDDDSRTGWSVLLVGRAHEIGDLTPVALGAPDPEPWAEGVRDHLVRIKPGFISGRRISR